MVHVGLIWSGSLAFLVLLVFGVECTVHISSSSFYLLLRRSMNSFLMSLIAHILFLETNPDIIFFLSSTAHLTEIHLILEQCGDWGTAPLTQLKIHM